MQNKEGKNKKKRDSCFDDAKTILKLCAYKTTTNENFILREAAKCLTMKR